MNQVARFLDNRGMPERALEIATDTDYRFELAVQLGHLDIALDIAQTSESQAKWKQLGELALSSGKLEVRICIYTSPARKLLLLVISTPTQLVASFALL